MKQIAAAAAATILLALPASAFAGDYDKTEKTKAYEVSLHVPAAAMAIAPLKAEIMARWKRDSSDIKSQAVSALEETLQYFHPYALDTTWRVTFESARVISLSGNSFVDEGGAHPNGAFDSIVWDKQTNRAVPMEALFVKGRAAAAFKAIAASARTTWLNTMNKVGDGPADPAMADEGIGEDAQHLGHYALTYAKGQKKANGIVLLYGAGEAWPHVLGDFRLAVPVSVFRAFLTPEWKAEFE